MVKNRTVLYPFLLLFIFLPFVVQAVAPGFTDAGNYLNATVAPTGIQTQNIQTVAGNFIKITLTTVGTVFFILMVYGGFLWMTAKGKEEQVEKARDLITAAVIGIVVVVGAYAITQFIVSKTSGAAGAVSQQLQTPIQ